MKVLIATHNQGKFKEMASFLKDWGLNPLSLADLSITSNVEETGSTFEENALIKSMYFCQKTNLATVADDSGLEIDALDGAPGIKSRRWKGYRMTDQEMVDYTLEKLKDVPEKDRTCHMVCVVSLILPDMREFTVRASLDGTVTTKQMLPIEPGYPFRSIFYVPEFDKMLGELTAKEHKKINHRLKALNKLKCHLCK